MAHFRNHWKKYTFGSVALSLLGRWGWKKNEENNVIRSYCLQAKKFGQDTVDMVTRPKKMYVFMNPEANKKGARKRFQTCSAPLFHLSGMDVIVIESDSEGQIQTLLGYIDPTSVAIVVAGGGGTLMEVVNGLMRRSGSAETVGIPIGIVPLGKENSFFRKFFNMESSRVSTRTICEATMAIIKGHTVPVSVLKLMPEKGNVLYALSSVEWGAVNNAEMNKDSFKLLGRLRTVCSYINTAVRKWPEDFTLDVWCNQTQPKDKHNHSTFSPLGFKLLIDQSSLGPSLTIWPTTKEKGAFIKQGWKRTLDKTAAIELTPQEVLSASNLTLSHKSAEQQWYSIDGEPFEAISFCCSTLPNSINIFCPFSTSTER